jgi:hypothetical protein
MTMLEQETRSERDQHCDGLQALVDLLRGTPDLQSPFEYAEILNSVSHTKDPKGQLAAWARATSHLRPTKSYDGNYAELHVTFGPHVEVQVYAGRELVCDRIVTGTSTVTKTVKDPAALAAVPDVEVTEEVETVEWVCGSLLAVSP